MTVDELNDSFGLAGALAFDEHEGLTRAQVTLPNCTATVYLHGAHLALWQPTGAAPALYLSPRSGFADGKAIRGGIPLCWPWFGPRAEGEPGRSLGPTHGFARLQAWDVAFAALLPGDSPTLRLTFALAPTAQSRELGFDHFRVACEMIFGADSGRTLTLRFSVANTGQTPLRFEEALHTYLHTGDVRRTTLTGLEGAPFLDNRDNFRQKLAPETPLALTAQTDRVFPGAHGDVTLHDQALARSITVAKRHSATTVVWNPWQDGAATTADLPADGWTEFLCVETANTGADAITLPPGQSHTMEAQLTVLP